MVGLYETALDELCSPRGGRHRRSGPRSWPRPPRSPGREPDPRPVQSPHGGHLPAARSRPARFVLRRDAHPPQQSNARLYVGVAAQGRSPKVVMLRVYLALLAAAQKWYDQARRQEGRADESGRSVHDAGRLLQQPARAGRRRRLIEDEVRNRLVGYATPEAGRRSRGTVREPQDRLRAGRADQPRQHRQGGRGQAAAGAAVSATRSTWTWPSPPT